MKKRILSILMTLCMVTSLFSGMGVAFADSTAQLIVSTQTAKAGDEVALSVSTVNNPGVAVLTLGINYDAEKLELVGFENSGFTGWTVKTSAVWVGDNDSTYNGEILKLKFKVLDGASGKTEVTLRCGDGDAYNYDEEPVSFEVVSGGVVIEKAHTHSYTEKVTAPTCTEKGYTTHTCACGDSYIDSYTNPLGHSYGEWNQTKAPTCTEKGSETRTCTRCNASEARDVASLGHNHNAAVTAPTCTARGYTTHTCACGDRYIDSYTNPLGHSYGEWNQTKAPTCTEKGSETRTCTRCNASEARDVASLGHNHNAAVTAPTCTARGYTTYTCSCGDSYVDNYTDRLGHDYVNGICSRCGEADHNYKLAAPELKITTSSGKPKVYWNEVDGAVKYWLYRSTDGVKFNYYDTTTSTNYTNRSTNIGTTYYYKVKAIDANDARSEFSVVKRIMCKPAAPTVSINRSNGKPKLSWKSVSGAKKYWVYRSTDGKNFKYWDSTTKTNYTNKGAASGTKYYYRVKAVAIVNGNNVASANSNTKNLITTLAKPSVSITTSGGKPKLTWKAVTGADKYYVYRSTDGKNFKYWESTTKTSYINTGAKRNTRYYYKVKAVCAANSNANSARSASVSIKATK